MIKKTDIKLYPYNVWTGVLSDKEEVLRRFDFFTTVDHMLADKPIEVNDLDFDSIAGITYVVRERKTRDKGSLTLFNEEITTYNYHHLFNVISHEAGHAADIMWQGLIGMNAKDDFDSNNKNEPYIYLLGHIAGIMGSYVMNFNKEQNGIN